MIQSHCFIRSFAPYAGLIQATEVKKIHCCVNKIIIFKYNHSVLVVSKVGI